MGPRKNRIQELETRNGVEEIASHTRFGTLVVTSIPADQTQFFRIAVNRVELFEKAFDLILAKVNSPDIPLRNNAANERGYEFHDSIQNAFSSRPTLDQFQRADDQFHDVRVRQWEERKKGTLYFSLK